MLDSFGAHRRKTHPPRCVKTWGSREGVFVGGAGTADASGSVWNNFQDFGSGYVRREQQQRGSQPGVWLVPCEVLVFLDPVRSPVLVQRQAWR